MSTRVIAAVVCCILMQILCVVSQIKLELVKDFVPQTPYGGLICPWTPLGDFCPTDLQSSLCPPNNPVRSTPLIDIISKILGDITMDVPPS